MNNWDELGNNFIKQKRYLGYKYNTDSIIIKDIIAFLTKNNIEFITKEVIEKYVRKNQNISNNTIARNANVFRKFNKYLLTQGIKCYQIPKKLYPQKRHSYIPYIFSVEEIKSLINASYKIEQKKYSYVIEKTIPIILKLLYQTGMRLGEVLSLKISDYLENEMCLYIKETKNNQERLIYLSSSLNSELSEYHKKFHFNKDNSNYFFQLNNNKISHSTIEKYFYIILKQANIQRQENSPTVHNLRHTYIVHVIEKWLKEGKNIDTMLPILRVQVGHQSIKSLEYYIRVTKNILGEINKISESKLGILIPNIKDNER